MANVEINDLVAVSPVLGTHQFEIDISGTSSGKVTGTSIRTFVLTGFTASRAVEIDGSGNVIASSITASELSRLSGVTSNIQTQLDGKVGTSTTITAGVGLTGGGDLSANRTIDLDINDLTADTPVAGDSIAFYDLSGTDNNKCTITVLMGIIDHGSITGLGDDDHSQYSLATGTRWTTTQTASRAVETNGSGHIIVSATTTADLAEIAGVANFDQGIRVYMNNVDVSTTGAVTLSTTHQNAFLYCTNSSTTTFTIPPNSTTAFATGTEIEFWRSNSSVVITEGSGVTLNGHDGTAAITSTATIGTQHTGCVIKKVATDTWVCLGRFTSS